MTSHWFEPLADHMGPAYLRYSFTKGTQQEVTFLIDALALAPGDSVLDVGCGPGRHVHAFARLGFSAHGVDISERFIDLARASGVQGATFERGDARSLGFDGRFDAAISLCQGGFGLLESDEENQAVIAGMVRALRPGGRLALSAFSAYFRVKYQGETDFDAVTGVSHEHTEVRDTDGAAMPAELWTTCFTPRELRMLLASVGARVDHIWSVEPGSYGRFEPTIETPEFLVIATRIA